MDADVAPPRLESAGLRVAVVDGEEGIGGINAVRREKMYLLPAVKGFDLLLVPPDRRGGVDDLGEDALAASPVGA